MPGFLAEQLTRPENRWLHVILKTAANNGVPPSLFTDPSKTTSTEWTAKDKKLAVAWQTLQDETCPRCGTPTWLGHTEDERVDFESHVTICYACQHLEQEGKKAKELPAGATRYVKAVPVAIEGEVVTLPTRAEGYKRSQ